MNFINVNTEIYYDGSKLADIIKAGRTYDIICLDIEMRGENGISVARRIREYEKDILIIYISSHENYMKESFSVQPFQYLIKPIKEQHLEECIKKAYEEILRKDLYFRYTYNRVAYKIPIYQILYFESNRRKIKIITEDNEYSVYGKLNDLEQSMKRCKLTFLRVHQSFLVNYKHVTELSRDFLVLDNGQKISISKERQKMISQQYCTIEESVDIYG